MSNVDNNMDFQKLFEAKLVEYTGFRNAICVDCCTNAILLSLEMLRRLNRLDKTNVVQLPRHTYMSVPMTLLNNGWKFEFVDDTWRGAYQIGNTNIFDAATDMHMNMRDDIMYDDKSIVCISFQQKKRLSLGRGGAILFDDNSYVDVLRRLRYDGRNPYISDKDEITKNQNDIICGYHCYMEPDKAAKGILLLNQQQLLRPYVQHSWDEYPDLTRLTCLK